MKSDPKNHSFSFAAARLLIELEDLRLEVYTDSAGFKTIGVGHMLTRSELSSGKVQIGFKMCRWSDGLTLTEALELLEQDLTWSEAAVNLRVDVDLSQRKFDALVIFVFNVGRSAFENSTLLRLLNDGKYKDVPSQMRRWKYAGGEVIQGLVNRREREIKLWNTPTLSI